MLLFSLLGKLKYAYLRTLRNTIKAAELLEKLNMSFACAGALLKLID